MRRLSRRHDLTVRDLPGRGKGSHRIYVLVNDDGTEVARFGLTSHGSKEMSWRLMTELENGLAQLFGDKWTERR
ncbi:MAG: hypothetical protein ACRDN9_04040 [Streptosporangiaceae bacterium]